MIKSIKLRNFKSHKDTEIALKPVSLFIGNNNAGKSSVYQSLLLLRDAVKEGHSQLVMTRYPRANSTPEDPIIHKGRKSIDVYDYEDMVFKTRNAKETDGLVSIEISAELFIPIKTLIDSDRWKISVAATFRHNRLIAHSGSISFSVIGEPKVQWRWEAGAGHSVSPASLSIDGTNVNFDIQGNLNFLYSSLTFPANLPTELKEKARNLSNEINSFSKRLFESFRTVYPIRGMEESVLPLPKQSVSSGDHFFHPDRQVMLAALLANDRDLENYVSEQMASIFGVGIEIEHRPPYQLLVKTKIPRKNERAEGGLEGRTSANMFVNEGLGINQMPFMLVPLVLVDKGETVILCEPEAHLNPMIQSKLVEALARVVKEKGIQLVIETHSEHILNAFIYRVMKKEISSDDLGIFHFETNDEVSSVREIEIGKDGRLKEGLPGFFDVSLEELSRTLQALSK